MAQTIPAPLAERYAIVTGGSQGIGAAIAVDLARKGAAGIAITYNSNLTAAEEVLIKIRALGVQKCAAIKADLISPDFGTHVLKTAFSELQTKKIHVLVNNAAYAEMSRFKGFESETLENFNLIMQANVFAPMDLIRAALDHIPESGRIINISSVAGRRPNPDSRLMYYGASKAALDGMTRCLAVKYAPLKKITINTVCVGPTMTQPVQEYMRREPQVYEALIQRPSAERRLGTPEDVAGIVSFLAGEESRWINGCSVPADGGSMLPRQG